MPDLVLRRHERFWFADGSLQLNVEDTLYRVHRYLFETYAKKFFGASDGISHQGLHILDDVKKVDFDRLLSFLYPRDLGAEEKRTQDEWTSVLKLASKWGFESLQTKAVSRVAEFASPIDKIALGREYNVPDLLLPGYVALCQSDAPLSQDEGRRLGLEVIINIYNIRQELRGSPTPKEEVLAKVKAYLDPPAIANAPPQSKVPPISPTPSPVHAPQLDSPNEPDSWDEIRAPDVPKAVFKGPPKSPYIPEEEQQPKSPFNWGSRKRSSTALGFSSGRSTKQLPDEGYADPSPLLGELQEAEDEWGFPVQVIKGKKKKGKGVPDTS